MVVVAKKGWSENDHVSVGEVIDVTLKLSVTKFAHRYHQKTHGSFGESGLNVWASDSEPRLAVVCSIIEPRTMPGIRATHRFVINKAQVWLDLSSWSPNITDSFSFLGDLSASVEDQGPTTSRVRVKNISYRWNFPDALFGHHVATEKYPFPDAIQDYEDESVYLTLELL